MIIFFRGWDYKWKMAELISSDCQSLFITESEGEGVFLFSFSNCMGLKAQRSLEKVCCGELFSVCIR